MFAVRLVKQMSAMPAEFGNDLQMVKLLVDEMSCTPVELLKKLTGTYAEKLSASEQMLAEYLMRIVPYLRMYTLTVREIINQCTMPPRIPKLREISRKREKDGVVKRGELVTYVAEAIVKGKTIKKDCVRIRCVDCGKNFNSMDNFVEHRSCKSERKRAPDEYIPGRKCPKCRNPGVDLSHKYAYEAHTERCRGHGTTSSKRRKQKKGSPSYFRKCEKCRCAFTDHPSYMQHSEACTVERDENVSTDDEHVYQVKYICEECGKSLTSKHNYEQHVLKHERDEVQRAKSRKGDHKLVECKICKQEQFEYNMPEHMKLHKRVAKKGKVNCPFCKRETHRTNMIRHLNRNYGECAKQYHKCRCPLCTVQFSDVEELVMHLPCVEVGSASHASGGACSTTRNGSASCSTTTNRDSVPAGDAESVSRCKICKYAFSSQQALEMHVSRIHPDLDETACSACGAKYYSTGADVEHQKICEAPRPCRYCFEMLRSDDGLMAHAATCLYALKCMACLQTFGSRSELKSHVEHSCVRLTCTCAKCGFMCEHENAKDVHESRCTEGAGIASSGNVQHQQGKQTRAGRHLAIARRRLAPNCPPQGGVQVKAGQGVQVDAPAKVKQGDVDGKVNKSERRQVKAKRRLKVSGSKVRQPGQDIFDMQTTQSEGGSGVDMSKGQSVDVHVVQKSDVPRNVGCAGPSKVNRNEDYNWSAATKHIEQRIKSADALRRYLQQLQQEIPPLVTRFTPEGVDGDRLDDTSVKFLSPDILKNWYPVQTGTDGNCMMRSISRVMFGTEKRYKEVRIRLAIEAMVHESRYLSETELMRGMGAKGNTTGTSLAWHYMGLTKTFVDECKAGKVLENDATLSKLFQQELFRWSKNKVWLGLWQLHMASNVFRQTIELVHPISDKHHRDWHLFNRAMIPQNPGSEQRPLRIMFTSTGAKGSMPTLGEMNHFVPLIRKG